MPPRRPQSNAAIDATDKTSDGASDGGGTRTEAARLLRVFARVADKWQLSADDRRALLGVAPVTYAAWMGGRPPRALPPDVYARVGHVVGIDLALQAFYGPGSENAATHIHRLHTAPDGQGTALTAMRSGLAGLVRVRRDLEAHYA